eukprot:Gb_00328 [translate_table: standard]
MQFVGRIDHSEECRGGFEPGNYSQKTGGFNWSRQSNSVVASNSANNSRQRRRSSSNERHRSSSNEIHGMDSNSGQGKISQKTRDYAGNNQTMVEADSNPATVSRGLSLKDLYDMDLNPVQGNYSRASRDSTQNDQVESFAGFDSFKNSWPRCRSASDKAMGWV